MIDGILVFLIIAWIIPTSVGIWIAIDEIQKWKARRRLKDESND